MANFKLEIRKQYGKFQHRIYPTGGAAPDHAGDDGDLQGMLASVKETLGAAGVGKGDSVTFRNIAYDSHAALMEAVRTAPY